MKSEVKLNPNLRRLHSITKTDKGKDKNKTNSSLWCRYSACVQRWPFRILTVVEPRSHHAGNRTKNGAKSLSVVTYVTCDHLQRQEARTTMQYILTVEIATPLLLRSGPHTKNGIAFLLDYTTRRLLRLWDKDALFFSSLQKHPNLMIQQNSQWLASYFS